MRLGQLARKLALRPAEITQFLAANNIQIEEGVNTKLEDTHLSLILQQFAPDMAKDISEEVDIPEILVEPPQTVSNESDVSSEKSSEPEVAPVINETQDESIELIKAAKVELSGLKVLGKIELPEPKKKETTLENGAEEAAPKTLEEPLKNFKEERKNSNLKPHRASQRPLKNPIALEREREAQEAQKKREEEAKLRKELRTQNYLKKVKSSQPTKAVRLVNEPVMEMSAAELEEPPKTWWGKFRKWLTT